MRWGVLTVLACGITTSAPLKAESPSLDLRGVTPPMDPQSSLSLEPTSTPGHGNFGMSLWANYAYRVVRVEDENGHQLAVPIRHQLSYDALMNLGLGERWALGLALPVVLYQQGDRMEADSWRPPKTALGDPTVELKATILPKGKLGGYGLAGYSRVTLPLGSPESGVGTDGFTAQLGLRGELDLILANVRAQFGYAFRDQHRVWWGDQFGNYVPWALGLGFKPQALGLDKSGHWQWFLESRGAVAITPEFATKHSSPALLGISARYSLGADFSTLLGAEIPLNGAVGAPSVRAIVGLSWAPRFLDADGDGIADDADDCPEGMPEDRDGFEDDDGCPEDDNDGDGVPDGVDQCPSKLEDLDGYQDEDGCPDLDNDGDKIPDANDACPMESGVISKNKKFNGCAPKDSDNDGILDDVDRCPTRPEDRDGRHDQDGCPDPDDDADRILDEADDCPTQRGPQRSVPGLNGCPDPDADFDTYFGTVGDQFAATDLFGPETRAVGTPRDLCADEAEDFDGDRDDDGCIDPNDPKKKTLPLVSLELSGAEGVVKFARAPKWSQPTAVAVDATDLPLLRALAKELRNHREYTAQIGVKPRNPSHEAVELATIRAQRLVLQLNRLSLRDNSAIVVDFAAVKKAPGAAASGVGVTLTTPKPISP
jgi:OmpA-OmpF porin, OOP family